MRTLITGGTLIDPLNGFEGAADILIEDGLIKTLAPGRKLKAANGTAVFDASGMYVMPGLLDMHTHLREPGFEHKETIRTGTLAALRGGFTAVCPMPNTNPVNDNAGITEYILSKAATEGNTNVYPIGAVTKEQKGEELAELYMMREAGCIAFSDDGNPVRNPIIMRRALEYARGLGALIISHCEEPALSEGGVMNEGVLSISLGLKGAPSVAEEIAVFRDIALAEYTGGRLHIAHVSTEGSVRIIREAKERGRAALSAETCPHYFSLTEDAVRGYNTNAKVNPPLRGQRDVDAVREGLRDGTIDAIATDHAPHGLEEKTREFDAAPFGISGIETALGLGFTLVGDGVLSMSRLVEKLSLNPARILGIGLNGVREGSKAELCIFDPQKKSTVDRMSFLSRGKNSPFDGLTIKGAVAATFFRGKMNKWQ